MTPFVWYKRCYKIEIVIFIICLFLYTVVGQTEIGQIEYTMTNNATTNGKRMKKAQRDPSLSPNFVEGLSSTILDRLDTKTVIDSDKIKEIAEELENNEIYDEELIEKYRNYSLLNQFSDLLDSSGTGEEEQSDSGSDTSLWNFFLHYNTSDYRDKIKSRTSTRSFPEPRPQQRIRKNKTPSLLVRSARNVKANPTRQGPARKQFSKIISEANICGRVEKKNQSLQCYQCISHLSDKEPKCDNNLWKHLRHSEKFELRSRCKNSEKSYCSKRIRQKLGERITERGCFEEDSLNKTKTGSAKVANGCATFPDHNYLTTICFCNENLCNSAAQFAYPGTDSVLYGAGFIICACLFIFLHLLFNQFLAE